MPRCARCRPRGRCRSPTSRVRGVFPWGRKVSRSAGGERRREICPSKGRPQFLHHRQLAAWKRRGSKRGEIEAVLAHALGHAVYVFSALGRRRAFDPEDSSQSISTFPRSCFRRLRNKRSRVSEAHTSPRIAPSRVCLTTSATMPRDMTGTCRFALCNVLHVFLSSTSRVRGPVDAPMPRTVRSLCFGLWGRRWFASRGRYVP